MHPFLGISFTEYNRTSLWTNRHRIAVWSQHQIPRGSECPVPTYLKLHAVRPDALWHWYTAWCSDSFVVINLGAYFLGKVKQIHTALKKKRKMCRRGIAIACPFWTGRGIREIILALCRTRLPCTFASYNAMLSVSIFTLLQGESWSLLEKGKAGWSLKSNILSNLQNVISVPVCACCYLKF